MIFQYEIRRGGQNERGELEAATEQEAANTLRDKGGIVLSLAPKREQSKIVSRLTGRVSLKDRILFTKQLAVMIKAGLPLDQALKVLFEQIPSKAMGQAVRDMARDVEGGEPLSQSMAKHEQVFSAVYINLIKSGERSGKLEEVLFRLAEQQEKDYELVSKVRGAMIYPIVIFTALIAVVLIIVLFVMPQIEKIFSDLDATLPLPTRVLLSTSAFIRQWFIVIVSLMIAAGIGIRVYVKRSTEARERWDALKLKLPIFGPLMKKIAMARFTRTTATLITAGLPMLEILDTTADVMGNVVYHDAVKRARNQVEAGVALSKALSNEKVIPPIVSQVVAIGEKSGNLDFSLANIADFYDKEVDATTRNLSSILEPILMIAIGIGVGFVVISVISPIYNLVNVT
jgi:type IV pilus assembly protein PilC